MYLHIKSPGAFFLNVAVALPLSGPRGPFCHAAATPARQTVYVCVCVCVRGEAGPLVFRQTGVSDAAEPRGETPSAMRLDQQNKEWICWRSVSPSVTAGPAPGDASRCRRDSVEICSSVYKNHGKGGGSLDGRKYIEYSWFGWKDVSVG